MEIVNQTIKKFINEMKYLENEHVLGIFFYGSYLTGYNTKNSDIDLHVIFDNYDPKHLIRGNQLINGIKIDGIKLKCSNEELLEIEKWFKIY